MLGCCLFIEFRIIMTDPFNHRTSSQQVYSSQLKAFSQNQPPVSNPLICIYMSTTVVQKMSSTALDNHLFTGPSRRAAPCLKGHLGETSPDTCHVSCREKQLVCKVWWQGKATAMRV